MLSFGLGSSVLILLSLALATSGGENSDVPKLGGEGPLPSFTEKKRVSMGRAHAFWRVKAEKKIKGVFNKEGTLTLKLVNVLAVDNQFSDIANTFNRQHDDHSDMKKAAQKLKEVSGCAPTASLRACIETVQQEHGAYKVQVQVEGDSFSLIVKEKELPEKLKQVLQQVGELSLSTKRVLARKTILQEMICSVLQSQAQLEERIKTTNPEYLDQVRLEGNLRENILKLSLAKQLSEQYDEAARSVLREMSQLAGLMLEKAPEIGTE